MIVLIKVGSPTKQDKTATRAAVSPDGATLSGLFRRSRRDQH